MSISKQENTKIQPFIKLQVLLLEAEMTQRTYDEDVTLRLGGVQVTQYHKNDEIYTINTPMSSGRDEYLITVEYVNVSPSMHYYTLNFANLK